MPTAKAKRAVANRSKSTVETPAKEKDLCFVIMPFGGWLDDYYEAIYCPAIEAAGLEPHRADDLFRPSTIVNDIWAYTRRAKLLLADLSGKNPNVFYELGLAHALGKPAILVAESMDEIPFDLRALRIIVYDKNDPRWGDRLSDKVTAPIREIVKSPKEAVLPAFLEVRDSSRTSVTAHEKELIEIKQELDLLRREVRSRAVGTEDVRFRRPSIGSSEATRMVRELLALGLGEVEIVSALAGTSVPPEWIRRKIREFQPALPLEPAPSPNASEEYAAKAVKGSS